MKRSLKNVIMIVCVMVLCCAMFLTMHYAQNHLGNDNQMGNMNSETFSGSPSEVPNDMPESSQGETPPEKPDGENTNDISKGNQNEPPLDMTKDTNHTLSYIYYFVFGFESFIIAALLCYLVMSQFNKLNFKETYYNTDKYLIGGLCIVMLTASITYLNIQLTNKYFLNNATPSIENNQDIVYSAAKEINTDTTIESGDFESTNENAIMVTGNITSTLSNINVSKTEDSNGGDNTSFYGMNSAIIAKDGATLTLDNVNLVTDAIGANGVFSYGGSATTNNSSSDGTTINISNSTITTKKDNSGGMMTTGGGTTTASQLTVSTAEISSAAIRTDRGGGTVNVDGGTYTTTGQGSPAIYSTANVNVSNAKLVSKTSEGVVIEGKNSVTLENVTLTDSNTKLNGQSTTYKNIFLYQSMSGDAADDQSELTAKDSTITTNQGDSFYVTNTSAIIHLTHNTIINNDTSGNFLRVQKDSWGNSGTNGGSVTLNMTNQSVNGNIVIDSISTLSMNLDNYSYYEGTINSDNIAEKISLKLDKTSHIKLTGDTYITDLDNADSSHSNIDFNGYHLYVNNTAINKN